MDSRDPRPPASDVERLVERYLDGVTEGRAPDLEELARTLSVPADRERFRARALAEEYLARSADGDPRQPADYLARLSSAGEREQFLQVLRDAQAARALLPGELLPGMLLDGRYEIRREVGRGGMGIVYAAFDQELEREVAIKLLRLPGGGTVERGWEELFQRESKTLAKLESKNIVAIHDARRGAEHSYIVMDLVRGTDLLHIIARVHEERARLGPRRAASPEPLRAAIGRSQSLERADLLGERTHARCAARILRAIAFTVERAHAAGVIHRDLKPQNVLLVSGGEPVLLDFGLASWGGQGLEEGFRGTPEYMAPEQIQEMRAGNDPRTDVYQLGLILYELLALRRAFVRKSGDDLWPLFQRILGGKFPPLAEAAPDAPRSLVAIASRALEREPARRYSTVRALREDLDRFLKRLPPKEAPLPRAHALALRARWIARQPLAAVALAVAVAAFFWLRPGPWVPPDLTVLRTEDGRLERLENQQEIELAGACILGLEVDAADPTWLYVFSVFGETPETRYLRVADPMPYQVAARAPNGAPATPGRIELGEGRHELACAKISEPDEPGTHEGLLVFACAEENPLLEAWQAQLLELESSLGVPTPYADGMRLPETLSQGMRGERLSSLTLEERSLIFGQVHAADLEEPAGWRTSGVRRYDFRFPLKRSPARAGGDGR